MKETISAQMVGNYKKTVIIQGPVKIYNICDKYPWPSSRDASYTGFFQLLFQLGFQVTPLESKENVKFRKWLVIDSFTSIFWTTNYQDLDTSQSWWLAMSLQFLEKENATWPLKGTGSDSYLDVDQRPSVVLKVEVTLSNRSLLSPAPPILPLSLFCFSIPIVRYQTEKSFKCVINSFRGCREGFLLNRKIFFLIIFFLNFPNPFS